MSSPFSKYQTERVMAEVFYSYYPHSKKLNKAIWDFFGLQDYLWLSEIKRMSKRLKIGTVTSLIYIQLLTGKDSDNPPLLRQNFYQLNDNGQLQLIRLSMKKVLAEFNSHPNKKAEEAFVDWAKSIFTCWEVIKDEEEPILLLDTTFNFPSNTLWNILENW